MLLPIPSQSPSDEPFIYVAMNEEWFSYLYGLTEYLKNRSIWDGTDEQIDDVIQKVYELDDYLSLGVDTMPCDCISELEFDSTTGTLTYKNQSGQTVTIMTQGDVNVSSNYYITPSDAPNASDIYCYAAQMIAERSADSLRDFLEVVDIVEEVTSGAITSYLKSFVDLVPFLGDFVEANLEIIDNLTEEIYDWVKLNVTDPDAISLAAEVIYCALFDAMEDGDPSDLRGRILARTFGSVVELVVTAVPSGISVDDLKSTFDAAYNATDESLLGYATLSWLLMADGAFDLLGADRPIQAIVSHAMSHAVGHDDRDCAGYPCAGWLHVFDFGQDGLAGWSSVDASDAPTLRYKINAEDISVQKFTNGGNHYQALGTMQINFASTTITRVVIYYGYDRDTAGTGNQWLKIGATQIDLSEGMESGKKYEWTGNQAVTSMSFLLYVDAALDPVDLDGDGYVASIYVEGTGENPFE